MRPDSFSANGNKEAFPPMVVGPGMEYQSPWNARLQLSDGEFDALEVGPRGNFDSVFLVDGLPREYQDQLLWAAQRSPHRHTWRVVPQDVQLGEEPDQTVLAQARAVLDRDVTVFGSRFISFVGRGNDHHELIGVAAIRRRMSESYLSRYWYILHRALLLPEFEGRFLGLLLIPLTSLSRQIGAESGAAAGFFISTRAPVVDLIVARGMRSIPGQVVPFGRKILPGFDAKVRTGVFGGVAEWLRPIVAECRDAGILGPGAAVLLEQVQAAWMTGADKAACAEMGRRLASARAELVDAAAKRPELAIHLDFLDSAREWGVLEA